MTALRLASAAAVRLRANRLVVTDDDSAALAERLIATNLGHPDIEATTSSSPAHLTVVVPVRDRPIQLDRCLAALKPLTVIVVDDASLRPAAVTDIATRHGAKVVKLKDNVGPAGARNAGLEHVITPLVAFVDSDVQVSAETLLYLTRHFADAKVALVGPRVVGRTHSTHPRWFERYDAAASSLTLGLRQSNVRPGATVAWLPSACLVGRVAELGKGFDPNMRVGEDVDLVWRIAAQGLRVRYAPEVVAQHDVRRTVRGWLGRKFVYGTGGAALAQRHGTHTAPAVLSPVMAVAGAAVLMRRPWSMSVASAAIIVASTTVHRALPKSVGRGLRGRVSLGLSVRGVGWAVRQQSALLLRHWWPASLLAARSSTVRRAVATALVVDTVVALQEHTETRLPLAILLSGRRLDDLAYGAGLWWGAISLRSTSALRPRRPRSA